MISRQSVTSIYSLAAQAEKNGLVVLPLATTPLAVINAAMAPAALGEDVVETVIGASDTVSMDGAKEHAEAMDEMVSIAAKAVSRQMKFARELVSPHCTTVCEAVAKYMETSAPANLRHSIETIDIHKIYDESYVADMVDRYKSQPQLKLPSLEGVVPNLTAEELAGRCKTGVKRIDEMLEKLQEDSPKIVTRTFDTYFVRKDMWMEETGSDAAERFVAFVLAKNLASNIPDGVQMDLDTYRGVMANYIAEFGRRVFQALRRRDRIVRQNDLVVHFPLPNDTTSPIRVNGPVYRKYLKEGGTPEAIIGACLRDISSPKYADLLEDAYGGEKAVKSNERAIQARVAAEREANITMALREAIGNLIKSDDIDEDFVKPTGGDVKAWFDANPYAGKMDEFDWARRAVCEIVFPDYNAYQLISTMIDLKSKDPELTSREAATLVTYDLVGAWLADQLVVEKA